MKIIPLQEALERKIERQRRVKGLERHAFGHCVHIGQLSPGCAHCFTRDPFYRNYYSGAVCNRNCHYCPSDKRVGELSPDEIALLDADLQKQSSRPDFAPCAYSFTGGGEPLRYLDFLEERVAVLKRHTAHLAQQPWLYLYTNGLLADEPTLRRLKAIGFDEVRFHIGASDFAETVYDNIRIAVGIFETVSVETPAWPPHRDQLFEMLPIIDQLGVSHLNLGEVEVIPANLSKISEQIPDAEVYHGYEVHLDDGGLVYDLMAETIDKGYGFSFLDCSSFVKNYQRGKAKWLDVGDDDTEGLFAHPASDSGDPADL